MKALFLTSIMMAGAAILLLADVKTDYSHSADWGRYHTYSWIGVQAGNSLWQDRIQRDVNMALGEKGWTQAASAGDASVSAFGSTAQRPTINTFYDGLGGGWFWHGFGDGMATTTVENQPVGTADRGYF